MGSGFSVAFIYSLVVYMYYLEEDVSTHELRGHLT